MTETFGFDPALYSGYRVLMGPGDTAAFVGMPRIGNRDFAFSLNTPQWQHVSLSAFYLWGADENFLEWAPGRHRLRHAGGRGAADRSAAGQRAAT